MQAGKESMARLVRELEGAGLLVERVRGVPAEFIKVSAAAFFSLFSLFGHSILIPTNEAVSARFCYEEDFPPAPCVVYLD